MCNKCNGNCNSCNCTCQKPCLTPDCACKVFITTDCVTLSEDLTCSNILKGQTQTEVLKQLDAYICERFESVENFFQIVNVGGGAGVYKGISVLGKKELKSLVSDGTITITPGTDTINFSVNFPPGVEQNNYVRQLLIDIFNLPSTDYLIEDLIDYILALPEEERTILETDSKWNIVIGYPSEGGYIVSEIYELQNKGKGIITELENENFLLITRKEASWNDTLRVNPNIIDGVNTQVEQSWAVLSNQGIGTSNGFYLKDISFTDVDIPIFTLGAGMGQTNTERSLAFYSDRTIFTDGLNSRGIEYANDYTPNDRTLITKKWFTDNLPVVDGSETKINAGANISISGLGTIGAPYIINSSLVVDGSETKINAGTNISLSGTGTIGSPYVVNNTLVVDGSETKINAGDGISIVGTGTIGSPYVIYKTLESNQKVITYPTDFTGINYTLLPGDHNKLIIVKNGATDVTITVPTGLEDEHFNAILRDGTGEITVTTSGTTLKSFDGFRVKNRYQQVALDRDGTSTDFYLTGNTKI